jgi:hypothetical protein
MRKNEKQQSDQQDDSSNPHSSKPSQECYLRSVLWGCVSKMALPMNRTAPEKRGKHTRMRTNVSGIGEIYHWAKTCRENSQAVRVLTGGVG